MTRWSAPELVRATGGMQRVPFHATGISIDSRTTRPGDLFVALATATGDGHAYVATALARDAAGAMVHALPPGIADDAPLLQVGDTLDALHDLGRAGRARFQGRVVAITGSVGKTTTKEMLRIALQAYGKAWAAEASHNNHWGVPLTLARTPPGHDYCVVEIGMNHAGEIAPLARMVAPEVAVVTAVTAAHIGHLGSVAAIAAEKLSIREGLVPGGVFIGPDDVAMPNSVDADADGSAIVVDGASYRIGAAGPHMVRNAMIVRAVLVALGLDPALGLRTLETFAPVSGRGARRAILHGSAMLLDESYNASSASVRAALAVLMLQPASRRVAVLGDMLELGAHAEAEHVGLAPDAARADLVFACGDAMRALYDALPPDRRGAHAPDSVALAPIVAGVVRAGDAVLVKGSLGSRMRVVVDALDGLGA